MAVVEVLARQRRFKKLLLGLLVLSLVLGLLIVPLEQTAQNGQITNYFNGIWWAVTTITSVGYGDFVPVTPMVKIIGMILQVAGVLAFGLMISMVTLALTDPKDRFYWHRAMERFDRIEERLDKANRHDRYMAELQSHEQRNNKSKES